MAHHGEEITNAVYDVINWSWSDHGDPPASVGALHIGEGYPIDYVDRSTKYPAVLLIKTDWPAVTHHPKITTEIYRLEIYVVEELPTTSSSKKETAIRQRAHSVVTNMLSAADTDDTDIDLDYPLGLSYVEDIRWMGTAVRDEIQELIDAMGMQYVTARIDFEIQAKGTER